MRRREITKVVPHMRIKRVEMVMEVIAMGERVLDEVIWVVDEVDFDSEVGGVVGMDGRLFGTMVVFEVFTPMIVIQYLISTV